MRANWLYALVFCAVLFSNSSLATCPTEAQDITKNDDVEIVSFEPDCGGSCFTSNGAINFPIDTPISVKFKTYSGEPIVPGSVNNNSIKLNLGPLTSALEAPNPYYPEIPIKVTYNEKLMKASIVPFEPLIPGRVYSITVRGWGKKSTNGLGNICKGMPYYVKSSCGVKKCSKLWSFRTEGPLSPQDVSNSSATQEAKERAEDLFEMIKTYVKMSDPKYSKMGDMDISKEALARLVRSNIFLHECLLNDFTGAWCKIIADKLKASVDEPSDDAYNAIASAVSIPENGNMNMLAQLIVYEDKAKAEIFGVSEESVSSLDKPVDPTKFFKETKKYWEKKMKELWPDKQFPGDIEQQIWEALNGSGGTGAVGGQIIEDWMKPVGGTSWDHEQSCFKAVAGLSPHGGGLKGGGAHGMATGSKPTPKDPPHGTEMGGGAGGAGAAGERGGVPNNCLAMNFNMSGGGASKGGGSNKDYDWWVGHQKTSPYNSAGYRTVTNKSTEFKVTGTKLGKDGKVKEITGTITETTVVNTENVNGGHQTGTQIPSKPKPVTVTPQQNTATYNEELEAQKAEAKKVNDKTNSQATVAPPAPPATQMGTPDSEGGGCNAAHTAALVAAIGVCTGWAGSAGDCGGSSSSVENSGEDKLVGGNSFASMSETMNGGGGVACGESTIGCGATPAKMMACGCQSAVDRAAPVANFGPGGPKSFSACADVKGTPVVLNEYIKDPSPMMKQTGTMQMQGLVQKKLKMTPALQQNKSGLPARKDPSKQESSSKKGDK